MNPAASPPRATAQPHPPKSRGRPAADASPAAAGQLPFSLSIPTQDGEFIAVYSECGLIRLQFPKAQPLELHDTPAAIVPAIVRQWHQLTTAAVITFLLARLPQSLPPLVLHQGTEFQRAVWTTLRDIPLGQTLTYAAVARALGRPRAVRAVGQACGANPLPLFVPCHRVVAAYGLGGFSGGLAWKRKLLQRERPGQSELAL